MSYIENIISVDFPENQYFKQEFYKSQICIHHTVSGANVDGDITWWKNQPGRIATSLIIDRNGIIYQCFSTKYWGYHLGVRDADIRYTKIQKYNRLDYTCIGIELDSWGGLVEHTDSNFYPAKWDNKKKKIVPNTSIKAITNVTKYSKPYKGYSAFETYTNEQIESLKELLVLLGNQWNIPLSYNDKMWNISADALSGKPGVWTHTSFRLDKSDCHPQESLITMLKNI